MSKKFKKIGSVLLVLTMLICSFSVGVYAAPYTSADGQWIYSYKSGKVTLTSYLGGASYVVIPQKVDGYDVVALEGAFASNNKIEEVIIPEGVESLSQTFTKSAVKKVTLPESLKKIEGYTFYQASALEEVIMKDGVTFIGIGAFYECSSLEYIDLPQTVEYIGTDAFRQSGIKEITIPGKVDTIFYNTFDCCYSLETVTICDGVKEIEECAFSECENLTKIIIPASVTNIECTGYEYGPFEYVKNLTIYGYKNTAAESFADEFGYKFAEIVPAKSVSVTPESCSIQVGETKQLTASVMPANASDKAVIWSSSDTAVVDVDSNGKVTGISNGTATITAKTVDGGFTDTCSVTVHTHNYTVAITEPTCTKEGKKVYTCDCGNSYTETIPVNTHNYTVATTEPTCTKEGKKVYTCDCGNSYTETIPANGHNYTVATTEPTCTKEGKKVYTCDCGNSYTEIIPVKGHKSNNIWVFKEGNMFVCHCISCGTETAEKQVSISANHSSGIVMTCGQENVKLSCTVTDNVTDDLVFTSSDTSVVTVSADGRLNAISKGTAVITVTIRNTPISITRKVQVNDKPVGIEIGGNTGSYSLNYGETLVLYAWEENLPEGAQIKWTAEGSGVTTSVSGDGKEFRITSAGTGTATVKVELVDANGETIINSQGKEVSDTIKINSNGSFWQKIVSFFKNLFGVNRVFYISAKEVERVTASTEDLINAYKDMIENN